MSKYITYTFQQFFLNFFDGGSFLASKIATVLHILAYVHTECPDLRYRK
jgi:hypothetical protein